MLPLLLSKLFVPNEEGELTELSGAVTEKALAYAPLSTGALLAKTLFTFIALIALIFASYWFVKRLSQNRVYGSHSDHLIQIIEKKALSPKTVLYVIEVEGKQVLLAESQVQVKKLESFDEASS